jgi:arsenite methyltransferase
MRTQSVLQSGMAQRADRLRDHVRETYSAIAESPAGEHVFAVGRALAENLGYPSDLLDSLPARAVEAFAGVSNVSLFADLPEAATVLDLGSGAGMDSLIAARRLGRRGFVVGVDFSPAMLARAHDAAAEAEAGNVHLLQADSEHLPLAAGSIDVALVNGIFNLNPRRARILAELARVLRPGGAVYAAELILRQSLPPEVKASEANWFA